MIVLRRLAHGVWDHAGVRFTEWLGAGPLLGVGYVLYAQPEALTSTPSFSSLAEWASPGTWSNVLMACALFRLVSLFVNGTFRQFPYSPMIRWAASCVAAMLWMMFAVGLFTAWRDSGGSPTGPIVYGTLIVLELRNAYVSRVDMASARGRASHAGADR